MGEVVQGDDGFEAAGAAEGEDLGVALEGGVVEGAGLGLEAGPLDREAEGVAADGGGPVEGLFGVAPEVAGQARAGGPAGALPGGPVVVRLAVAVEAALDLVARRGDADDEALAEEATAASARPASGQLGRRNGDVVDRRPVARGECRAAGGAWRAAASRVGGPVSGAGRPSAAWPAPSRRCRPRRGRGGPASAPAARWRRSRRARPPPARHGRRR